MSAFEGMNYIEKKVKHSACSSMRTSTFWIPLLHARCTSVKKLMFKFIVWRTRETIEMKIGFSTYVEITSCTTFLFIEWYHVLENPIIIIIIIIKTITNQMLTRIELHTANHRWVVTRCSPLHANCRIFQWTIPIYTMKTIVFPSTLMCTHFYSFKERGTCSIFSRWRKLR